MRLKVNFCFDYHKESDFYPFITTEIYDEVYMRILRPIHNGAEGTLMGFLEDHINRELGDNSRWSLDGLKFFPAESSKMLMGRYGKDWARNQS
jgi:hypothetical protein